MISSGILSDIYAGDVGRKVGVKDSPIGGTGVGIVSRDDLAKDLDKADVEEEDVV